MSRPKMTPVDAALAWCEVMNGGSAPVEIVAVLATYPHKKEDPAAAVAARILADEVRRLREVIAELERTKGMISDGRWSLGEQLEKEGHELAALREDKARLDFLEQSCSEVEIEWGDGNDDSSGYRVIPDEQVDGFFAYPLRAAIDAARKVGK